MSTTAVPSRNALLGIGPIFAANSTISAPSPRSNTARAPVPFGAFDFSIERLTVVARVALAAFTVLAIYLDPLEQPQNAHAAFLLLSVYLVFSLLVCSLVILGWLHARWHIVVHLIDIAMISGLMYFSQGPASPFFVFYTFVLVGAAFRWSWRGATWTTALLFASLLALTWATGPGLGHLLDDGDFELNRTIIRAVFLLVTGAMLASFSALREKCSERLGKLAEWPSPATGLEQANSAPSICNALGHVSSVLQAPRVLLIWEQKGEPDVKILLWQNGQLRHYDLDSGAFESAVAPNLRSLGFATNDVRSKTYFTLHEAPRSSDAPLVDRVLETRFGIRDFASPPFSGTTSKGRLFVLGRLEWTKDHLLLAEIASSRIGIELEHYLLRAELEETVAERERIRLARDLHDGILQSLTAAGLQTKIAISRADGETRQVLSNLGQLLSWEQRRVRAFVEDRLPKSPHVPGGFALYPETQRLLGKIKRPWGCEVRLTVNPANASIRRELGRQLDFILAETVANAVRHGQASCVEVTIDRSPDCLWLRIRDNGGGMRGWARFYDHAELAELNIGPVSLRNRIDELNGSLSLSNSPDGLELQVRLPLT